MTRPGVSAIASGKTPERGRRLRRAWGDLLIAAEGHLRGEDWDKEMREAVGEIKTNRDGTALSKAKGETDG